MTRCADVAKCEEVLKIELHPETWTGNTACRWAGRKSLTFVTWKYGESHATVSVPTNGSWKGMTSPLLRCQHRYHLPTLLWRLLEVFSSVQLSLCPTHPDWPLSLTLAILYMSLSVSANSVLAKSLRSSYSVGSTGNKQVQATERRAVWVSIQAEHDAPDGPPSWRAEQKIWRELSNCRSYPGCD
jgi:hypothetical protein